MTTKRVTFEYTFEYSDDELEDFSDKNVEMLAFETLTANIHDLGHGRVEVVEEP